MPFPSPPDGTEPYRGGTAHRAPTAESATFDYDVLTPERVSLQYDLAGIGTRAAAAMIDVSLQITAWAAVTIVMALGLGRFGEGTGGMFGPRGSLTVMGGVVLGVWTLLTFLILWGYFLVFEIGWNGQTPGKRILGLRVMRENGYPLRASDAVVRNLVRIVDGPPFMYPVGLLTMLLNDRARRLGDIAAGTVVVREGRRRSLASVAAWAPGTSSGVPGPRLSGADATLVRDYLLRRASLRPRAATSLAEQLARSLSERYDLVARRAALGDDLRFLEELVETPVEG